jgi:hypothetical protein
MTYAIAAYAAAGLIWVVYFLSLRARAARARNRSREGGT